MEKYLKCLHIHCNHVTDILIKCRQNHTPVALLKYKRMGQTGKSNGTRTSLQVLTTKQVLPPGAFGEHYGPILPAMDMSTMSLICPRMSLLTLQVQHHICVQIQKFHALTLSATAPNTNRRHRRRNCFVVVALNAAVA